MKARPKAGASVGEVYAAELPNGKFAACQVVRDGGNNVEVLALDWVGDEPHSLADVSLSLPKKTNRLSVERVPPYNFVLLGSAPLLASFEEPTNSYSGWATATYSRYVQWRWEQQVTEEQRAAYDSASGEVTLKLGGESHTLDAGRTWRLWLGPEQAQPSFAIRIDPAARIDWTELHKLDGLSEVIYRGRDPGFAAFLQSRKMIRRAFWYDHGQQEIDLRGSGVQTLGITAHGLRLHIDGVDDLTLDGGQAEIVEPRRGRGMRLTLWGPELPDSAICGLQALRDLTVWKVKIADLSRLNIYPCLENVTLRGAPGELHSAAALGRLQQLRRLELHDFYRCEIASFPDQWPALDTLAWHGLRKSDATILRGKVAGLRRVEIHGAKNDTWIQANLDNPFRDWIDDDQRLGKSACDAWRKAFNAARKKGADTEAVLRGFMVAMNKLDSRYGFDTIRREETYEAYHALVPDGMDKDAANEWFEELREF